MQPSLSVVRAQAQVTASETEAHPHPYLLNKGEVVTITNAWVGTVRVRMRAFYRFREILLKRGDVTSDDSGRSLVIIELLLSFACAARGKRSRRYEDDRRRDREGNLILVDEKMGVMYIIAHDDQLLLNIYDKSKDKDQP